MAAAIVGDHAVSALQEEHHLGIPVIGRERPAMMKEERLACAPIFVKNLRCRLLL